MPDEPKFLNYAPGGEAAPPARDPAREPVRPSLPPELRDAVSAAAADAMPGILETALRPMSEASWG